MTATSHKLTTGLIGKFPVPGDKSISHRSLIFSALSEGETEIHDILESDDVLCTARALRRMGIQAEKKVDPENPSKEIYHVVGGPLSSPAEVLYLGNSGTSARLLAGVIAGRPVKACLTGDESLSSRPMERVTKPLTKMGASFHQEEERTSLPLTVEGVEKPQAITYQMPVSSAQIKSAILFAGMNADGETVVSEPGNSRDHTERMMNAFGVEVDTDKIIGGGTRVTLKGGGTISTPDKIIVPADPSSAAFPTVAALLNEGSDVFMPNICMNPTRAGLYKILAKMGADIQFENKREVGGEPVADLRVRYSGVLKGISVPAMHVPSMIDEYPILAVAAAFAEGTTRMEGLAELRVKESNRLEKIAEGLNACGARAEIERDDLIVYGSEGRALKGGATIETGFDHRIAMSFLVMGTVTNMPITIDKPDAISTSFPNFIADMNEIGADIKLG